MNQTKKVLFVATVFRHFRAFHLPYIKLLKEEGWQVDVMAGGESVEFEDVDNVHPIDIQRSPFSLKNVGAYRQAKEIIEREGYDVVYCHTPMGAVIARLASMANRKAGRTKVIYCAHGFHFYEGAPLSYWLTYYPVEKFLARYTDTLVTINSEDYRAAKDRGFACGALYKIDGIGVNLDRFQSVSSEQKAELRKELSIAADDFVLIYTAEHNANKNHRLILDGAKRLLKDIPSLRVLFAGTGSSFEQNKEYAEELGISDRIDFLGYRRDIPQLVSASDVTISASLREGLPVNIIEALASARPIVASINRGHNELVEQGVNGFLFAPNDCDSFVSYIKQLHDDKTLYAKMSKAALASSKRFGIDNTLGQVMNIFKETIEG